MLLRRQQHSATTTTKSRLNKKEWTLLVVGIILIWRILHIKSSTQEQKQQKLAPLTTADNGIVVGGGKGGSSTTHRSGTSSSYPRYKTAYVTTLSTDSFVPGALVLWYSLNSTGSIRHVSDGPIKYHIHDDFVILDAAEPELSSKAKEKLYQSIPNLVIIPSSRLEKLNRIHSEDLGGRYKGKESWKTFRKLNVFNLIEYDFIVYLDADNLILKNISYLFPNITNTETTDIEAADAEPFQLTACVEKLGLEPELQGGLLAFPPSTDIFEDMKLHIDDPNYLCGFRVTEQSFLCHYFHPNHARINEPKQLQLQQLHYQKTLSSHTIDGSSTTKSENTMISNNSSNTTITNNSTSWLGGTWNPLPNKTMALYKNAGQKWRHAQVLNDSSIIHFNGGKPWEIVNSPIKKKLMKDSVLTKAWFQTAKQCGDLCIFESYLTTKHVNRFSK